MIKVMESSIKEEAIREEEKKKSCSDCKTTKTPLWRSGPSGPKSLCNACGIRYRKRRRSPSIEWKREKPEKRRNLKVTLMPVQRSQRQWGEVERAALLLMALSCGAVFA